MTDMAIKIDTDDYRKWVVELKRRYVSARLRAAMSATGELLGYYWSVGRDIAAKQYANTYGSAFYRTLSRDLRHELPDVKGLSETNLKYMFYFYSLYSQRIENRPQFADDFTLASLSTDLYEREGKAISNFRQTLPVQQSDLAQQITRDPYNFDFLTLTDGFKEKELEDALVANVTRLLLELGTGFAYMGRQIRLQVGSQEIFPDLLFYNTKIHAYCVVELKAGSFKAEYLGQLGLYVSTINHQMKTDNDNPTIGLLICRDKDNVMAQYALESISQPIGISEYQLSQIYPADFKSSLPSIEQIEKELETNLNN